MEGEELTSVVLRLTCCCGLWPGQFVVMAEYGYARLSFGKVNSNALLALSLLHGQLDSRGTSNES